MCDFWVVSGGKFQAVTSYYKLIPGRHSMRVNSSSLFFSSIFPYMKSPLSESVLLQLHCMLCSSNRMAWSTPAQYRSVYIIIKCTAHDN